MKVSLFTSCLVDQVFPEVASAAIKVLKRCGVGVEYDQRQTCCGQPAFNSGLLSEASMVARHFCSLYRDSGPVVVLSGSCASMVRVFMPGLFAEGSPQRRMAEEIGRRTYEFSEFLTEVLGVETTGARFPEVVAYLASCHLLRELGVSEGPRRLIRSVEGIRVRELGDDDRCCGFGGTFSVKFESVSSAMGHEKIRRIRETGARFVVGNDVSCLMHLNGLLRRQNDPVGTLHLAQVLAKF